MHYGRIDGKDPYGGEAHQENEASDQGYPGFILYQPWTMFHPPISSGVLRYTDSPHTWRWLTNLAVPPLHSLGKGVLTRLPGVGVDIPCLRRQSDADGVGARRLRE